MQNEQALETEKHQMEHASIEADGCYHSILRIAFIDVKAIIELYLLLILLSMSYTFIQYR